MTDSARLRKRLLLFGTMVPLLLIILTGCFGSSSTNTPVSTGKLVVDSRPQGAEIILDGKPTGHTTPHEFKDLAPGIYDLTLVLEGYPQQGPRGVHIRKGETLPLMIPMDSTTVTGRVVYGRGGPPVEGSIIEALREDANEVADRTTSDRDGFFTLNLEAGRYNIIARQPSTWAVGVAQDVEVPTNGLVEIIQRDLFTDDPDAHPPQVLSIEVEGLEPGDTVSEPRDITVAVTGEKTSYMRYIGVRVGHRLPHIPADPGLEDDYVYNSDELVFHLDPREYGPGDNTLHVAAYDIQLNSAQLVIPFTIAPTGSGGGEPLPAPEGLEAMSYTFLTPIQSYSVEQLTALAQELAPYGVTPFDLTPEVIPPYNRWVRLQWRPVFAPGVAGYRVYRRAEGSHESVVVATIRNTDYVDTSAGLIPGTRYYYSVRAYDESGQPGPSSEEIPVVLLEPFEVRLVRPAHHEHVPWSAELVLAWERNELPPIAGHEYEYVYRVAYSSELHPDGLTRPEEQESVRNREFYRVPDNFVYLMRGRTYQWDLLVAYAAVQLSEKSQAFSVSGRYHPYRDGLSPLGSSVNGAFRFTIDP